MINLITRKRGLWLRNGRKEGGVGGRENGEEYCTLLWDIYRWAALTLLRPSFWSSNGWISKFGKKKNSSAGNCFQIPKFSEMSRARQISVSDKQIRVQTITYLLCCKLSQFGGKMEARSLISFVSCFILLSTFASFSFASRSSFDGERILEDSIHSIIRAVRFSNIMDIWIRIQNMCQERLIFWYEDIDNMMRFVCIFILFLHRIGWSCKRTNVCKIWSDLSANRWGWEMWVRTSPKRKSPIGMFMCGPC